MTFWPDPGERLRHQAGIDPERYVLRLEEAGPFLAIDATDEHIHEVSDLGSAFQFRTHQRAMQVARELGGLESRRISVMKLV